MKKVLFTLIIGCNFLGFSQEITINDALRYNSNNIIGTARFSGMSGAFGAIGGDLSAININPAGSAIFNNNYVSATATSFNTQNKSNYFGSKSKENSNTLDLSQGGAILVFKAPTPENNWRKFSIGINYEKTGNFNDEIYTSGINPNNSISNYFVQMANGIPETALNNGDFSNYGFSGQQAYLGYQTYIIDPDTAPNSYKSNVGAGGNYLQRNYITSAGYNSKVSGNFATSYKDFLFLGMNLNLHFTDYIRTTRLSESNNNPLNTIPQSTTRSIYFDNEVYTYGAGFSLDLGAIIQATKSLRVGLGYNSPTWYNLNDELLQDLRTTSINNPDNESNPAIYPNKLLFPTYKLKSPGKVTGSLAYIFGNRGLLSLDVASKDYSSTLFKPKSDAVYEDLNRGIDLTLTKALEVRVGGEFRIKKISLRGGYRFEESPYKSNVPMSDLTGYSAGIGYNFGVTRIDLAYANSQRSYNQYLISSGMNDAAKINRIENNITFTYSINF